MHTIKYLALSVGLIMALSCNTATAQVTLKGGATIKGGGGASTPSTTWVIAIANNVASGATVYLLPGLNSVNGTNEALRQWPASFACTWSNFRILTSNTAGAVATATFRVNGADCGSPSTVSIAVNSTAGTYSDLTNTCAVAAGDLLSVKWVQGASSSPAIVSITSQCN